MTRSCDRPAGGTRPCDRCGLSVYAPWRRCNRCTAAVDGQAAGWVWFAVIVAAVLVTLWATGR